MVGSIQGPRIADAYIELGDDRMAVDPVLFFAGILNQAWDSNNTDGVKPLCLPSEEMKNVTFDNNDYINVYDLPEQVKKVTIDFEFESSAQNISLEMRTGRGRRHFKKLAAEAKRVVESYRRDSFDALPTEGQNLTGRVWFEWGRETSFQPPNVMNHRKVVEVVVHWEFREIQT